MDQNLLNPYVRRIAQRTFKAPLVGKERCIFDYDLIIVLEGEGILHIADKEYHMQKDDVVLIPPNIKHNFIINQGNFSQFFLHFDPIYSEFSRIRGISYNPNEKLKYNERMLLQENIFEKYNISYVFKISEIEKLKRYFHDISDAVNKNNSFVCKTQMLKILQILFKYFKINTESNISKHQVEEIKDFIDYNFEQPISLISISNMFDVNKFTISRIFKERYNKTIIEYYNDKRAECAKNLLDEEEMTISQISAHLNFTDVYTFSRFFKNRIGISPREYRMRTKR